ncbi:hypothetical protein LZ30DRAFT_766411 [Colletotrichum cereale]|nr:hypothetical protein LZ30DRAFT_766411 [Colletotrichum cereale]
MKFSFFITLICLALGVAGHPVSRWHDFLEELLNTPAWKSTDYDQLSMVGGDWGWFSSSRPRNDFPKAREILKALGFHQSETPFATRFDTGLREPPSKANMQRRLRLWGLI